MKIRFTVLIALTVLLGTFVMTVGTAGAVTKSQLKAKALSLSDMPTGWSVDNSSSSGSGALGATCLSGLKSSFKHEVKVSVTYKEGSNIPALQEVIETGPGVGARYRSFVHTLNSCTTISFSSDGQNYTGTVGAMSFPKLGTHSSAYSLALTDQGVSVGIDIVLFEVGNDIGDVVYEDLGTPDVDQLQSLAAKAVTKIAGTSASVKGQSTSNSPTNPTPLGQSVSIDGWTVKVLSVAPEATDPVTQGSAPTGYVFEVYSLHATRTAAAPAAPSTSLLADLVGPSKVERSVDSDPMCYGGSPDNDNVLQGGTTSFGACISVPASDSTNLVIAIGGVGDTRPIWFATK